MTTNADKQKEQMTELNLCREHLVEYAECIIRECNKWELYPEAISRHGYAQEKADMIIYTLKRMREVLQ